MVKINSQSIKEKIEMLGSKAINDALEKLKTSIEENTPEDTRELVNSYEIQKATNKQLTGSVYTNVEYARDVEYGQGRPFVYQKPKGNRGWRVGVGARMFAIGFDNARNEIIEKLQSYFRKK